MVELSQDRFLWFMYIENVTFGNIGIFLLVLLLELLLSDFILNGLKRLALVDMFILRKTFIVLKLQVYLMKNFFVFQLLMIMMMVLKQWVTKALSCLRWYLAWKFLIVPCSDLLVKRYLTSFTALIISMDILWVLTDLLDVLLHIWYHLPLIFCWLIMVLFNVSLFVSIFLSRRLIKFVFCFLTFIWHFRTYFFLNIFDNFFDFFSLFIKLEMKFRIQMKKWMRSCYDHILTLL